MKKVLTIAGSDCSGGAGIQADIKTITAHRLYAMSAITALTAQNTTGVYGIHEVPSEFIAQQLDCIFTDIIPDSIKIGMVSSSDIIKIIAERLSKYNAKNIVVDPVMVATSGSKLLSDDAITALVENLIPLAKVITPNIPEAECLSGIEIKTLTIYDKSAKNLHSNEMCSCQVGKLRTVLTICFMKMIQPWFKAKRINNTNTHGTFKTFFCYRL